jgi:hypothetical protein
MAVDQYELELSGELIYGSKAPLAIYSPSVSWMKSNVGHAAESNRPFLAAQANAATKPPPSLKVCSKRAAGLTLLPPSKRGSKQWGS